MSLHPKGSGAVRISNLSRSEGVLYKVVTAVLTKRQVSLNMTSCLLVNIYNLTIYQKIWCHIAESRNFMIYTWTVTQITQLSIPTHAQLQRHRLKFIKNHLKNSYMFRSSTIFRELTLSSLKLLLLLTTVGCFYAKSGDVAACRVVCIGLQWYLG